MMALFRYVRSYDNRSSLLPIDMELARIFIHLHENTYKYNNIM